MDYFGTYFRGFLRGTNPSQEGYSQSSVNERQPQLEPDALSASVNLEDIIDEYDEPSRKSRNTNDASNYLTDGQLSQSFFSFNGTARDDETTSFYSALHDGFSLNDFELSRNKSGREVLWKSRGVNNSSDELDTMLRRSDFQISWIDLTYTIRPQASYANVWEDFKAKVTDSLSSASLLFSVKAASYNISDAANNDTDIESNNHRDEITILQNVSGSFKSGELTAVMGPSGAGKTSLLNILARRREYGFTGKLSVSGTNHVIKINAIPQEDHLFESLTVRENLTFASKLKNPHSNQDHAKNILGASQLLGLNECLDTRTRNISGGQQKRLAIAQELLSKPDILILDEPTSGLDSLTCLKTLSVLKDLVKPTTRDTIDPIAIVLTIHQPQREAFEMFDKVYVLANGGITIYDGRPGDCIDFIEKYSGLKMPSSDYNPATFLIDIASGEYGQEPIDALSKQIRSNSVKLQEKLLSNKVPTDASGNSILLNMNPKLHMAAAETKNLGRTISSLEDPGEISCANSFTKTSPIAKSKAQLYLDPRLVKSSSISTGRFFYKTLVLTKRCWLTLCRDPQMLLARILFHIILPFVVSLIMGTGPGSSNACPRFRTEYSMKKMMESDEYMSPDVQEEFIAALENVGIIFITMYACISANIGVMTLMFGLDMRTCLKEYHNGWYSMNSYVFARLISNIPLDLTLPMITVGLTYSVTSQNTGPNDTMYMYRIIITGIAFLFGSWAGEIMGMIFGAIYVGHITTALFASQGATFPFVLLSGFITRVKHMSLFVRWLSYTSLYKHCLDASFIARYGWNVCGCDPSNIVSDKVTLTGVPDELRRFIKNFMNTQNEDITEATASTTSIQINSTEVSSLGQPDSTEEEADLFQMVAKQLSLYNTYGVEVKSCDQVVPYEMRDFGLTEDDLPKTFLSLIMLLLSMLLFLYLVVRLVLTYRTSL
jgi:ATP-binding cassette subfamily G (WHITE) protein 1